MGNKKSKLLRHQDKLDLLEMNIKKNRDILFHSNNNIKKLLKNNNINIYILEQKINNFNSKLEDFENKLNKIYDLKTNSKNINESKM